MKKNMKVFVQNLISKNIELSNIIQKNEKSNSKRSTSSKFNLQSAELALEAVRCEYESECNRSNELTARSGTFLSVMLLAFTFAINGISYDLFFKSTELVQADWRYGAFFFATLFCLLCAIVSLILLSLSVVTKSFQRLDCEKLNNEKNLSFEKGVVAKSIISIYTKSINAGERTNNNKAKLFNCGVWTGVAAILFTVIIQVMQSILKGVYYG